MELFWEVLTEEQQNLLPNFEFLKKFFISESERIFKKMKAGQ